MKSLKNTLHESLRLGINDEPEYDIVDFLDKFKWQQSTYNHNSSVAIKNNVYTDSQILDECVDVLKEMNMCSDQNDNRVYVAYVNILKLIKLTRNCPDGTQEKIIIYQGTEYTDDANNTHISYENQQKRENYGTELNIISGSIFDELMEKFGFKK